MKISTAKRLKGHSGLPIDNFDQFFIAPFEFDYCSSGENIFQVIERTGEFYSELVDNPDLEEKTVLISTHGFATRALLQQVYENKGDFWHDVVPANCAVNIVEVQNGKSTLVGDDILFYDLHIS